MKTKENNNLVLIRLFKNEDVNDMIKKACRDHNIKTAILISGIGQLKNVTLGYFKKKGDYSPQKFKKPLELLSLNGNIIKNNDEYLLHLHAILGDEDKSTIGGHFIDGKISVTGELAILKTETNAQRIEDEETGLKSLSI